ncbi:MAG TPA: thioredoxin fold domain-containing protein [Opitutaceae bacterium]
MKRILLLAAAILLSAPLRAQDAPADVESQVAEATRSKAVTVVHFWATWCPNCRDELKDGGWSGFIAAHPGVDFVFVEIWDAADGRTVLSRYGVGPQRNVTLLHHPNTSRKRGEMVSQMLGMPISWIPTTWVFRDGKLRYAMNYGELRFGMLDRLVRDTTDSWDR